MKIVAGMGSIKDYEALVKAGADEIFCGYVPLSWNETYGNLAPLNRREVFFYHVQIGTISDMVILKDMIEALHIPVTVALNALYYTQEQLPRIAEMMAQLMEIGFCDFIIADVGLLLFLSHHAKTYFAGNKQVCRIHISGELGEWNSNTIKLLQKKCFTDEHVVCSRLIFHRKNTTADMKSCIQTGKTWVPNLTYEAFVMNELCHFTGGFCNSLHCDEMSHICQLPYKKVPCNKAACENIPYVKELCGEETEEYIGGTGCGLCALWQLQKVGITHLKVVGRGKSVQGMTQDVQALRQALHILEEAPDEQAYLTWMKQELFPNGCSGNCYYVK